MPEFHPSIGDAVGAAMQHNIRLAHGGLDKPLQVRYLPSAAADPHSVRGMIARLTEDATPDEVAEIIADVNNALVGALPQLTELVAAAADWARVRLSFDDGRPTPASEPWTRLAAAYGMLQDAREHLEVAEDEVAACSAERTDPRHHPWVNVLRSCELLDDVFGTGTVRAPASARDPEADRQRVARTSTPQAGSRRPSSGTDTPPPVAPPPSAAPPAGRRR
ncbi:hypothetical protein ACGFYT_27490 [Streptomyces sp. NPDC048208]|uniref:hypothetical protein n=1 Tax=Streptomyces sp. NPDC048208 TaxID=3365515 RepID=UPI003718587A